MVRIKQFESKDLERSMEVVRLAFDRDGKDEKFNEWNFIDQVRNDKSFVDELCLIATVEDEFVGYNLLTKASIGNESGLVLGPLAVKPTRQKLGVGKKLVEHAIEKAKELGYRWISLTGGDYYYQFSFKDASTYGVMIDDGHPENKYLKILILSNDDYVCGGKLKFADSFYDENGELL
jgi:predicted N-acetyltransferase YhbS